ncbi:c-type cytochrome [Nguyenibacter vanlangensis]|uniref:C-type cytochrome n=1 Tax=Nguyenibacter vanlangensis TaxID=1216886 RepID=A0A7Y7ISZ3_9PROT|nr:c-type cytochrome [Nguyenibacter vanlangensis]NVN09597.1 c-type cytochrome [Nguyenibacter vanlangensis]
MPVTLKAGLIVALGIGVVMSGVAIGLVYKPPIATAVPPDPRAFPVPLIERGATLAMIGDCVVCHTAERGVPYAGGRPLATPFGTLYATNITPDQATGIGSWSFAAFRRAMREGISRDGSHLYPALPYEHFTHVTDDDLMALYAFLMTRRAIRAPAPHNELVFPLGFRPLLAGWNLLFLHRGPFVVKRGESAEWNRGAYLVEGLGHCGGCHTPRNLAGGEERHRAFAGGVAEGWNAPALDPSNRSPHRWTVQSLYTYLRTGIDAGHSAAAGPMGPVSYDLSSAPDADVRAIAVYVASLMRHGHDDDGGAGPVDMKRKAEDAHPSGAALFAGACGGCHGEGAPMVSQGRPSLSLVSAIQEDDPRNMLQAILQGIHPLSDTRGPYMPAFSSDLNDGQIVEIAAYLRARYSTRTPWTQLEAAVMAARGAGAKQ